MAWLEVIGRLRARRQQWPRVHGGNANTGVPGTSIERIFQEAKAAPFWGNSSS